MLYLKKKSPSVYKETQGSNASIILRYTKMPYLPKITSETKSGHNFLCPSERRYKPVYSFLVFPRYLYTHGIPNISCKHIAVPPVACVTSPTIDFAFILYITVVLW